jgi:hypothetical protein
MNVAVGTTCHRSSCAMNHARESSHPSLPVASDEMRAPGIEA